MQLLSFFVTGLSLAKKRRLQIFWRIPESVFSISVLHLHYKLAMAPVSHEPNSNPMFLRSPPPPPRREKWRTRSRLKIWIGVTRRLGFTRPKLMVNNKSFNSSVGQFSIVGEILKWKFWISFFPRNFLYFRKNSGPLKIDRNTKLLWKWTNRKWPKSPPSVWLKLCRQPVFW